MIRGQSRTSTSDAALDIQSETSDTWRGLPTDILLQVNHWPSRWPASRIFQAPAPSSRYWPCIAWQPEAILTNAKAQKPASIVSQVTCFLDVRSLQSGRLVCKAWRQGLSQGVVSISPRMEANALGLQWSELHKVQVGVLVLRYPHDKLLVRSFSNPNSGVGNRFYDNAKTLAPLILA